jgi:predicted NUDIX family NTP pyrophosphohydrolase
MPKKTAGLLVYRRSGPEIEFLLVHPGGPFWARKDDGAWSIPKGELDDGEDGLAAARREFAEETGLELAGAGAFQPLAPVKQPGGKIVHAWAVEGDCDATLARSNNFTMEWPPRSGRLQEFPECDRAAWFPWTEAKRKILKGQVPILEQVMEKLGIER